MKRPWQIWLLFLLCLALVLPAMGWLSLQALDLDQVQQQARRQAELEEIIALALYRFDAQLTPLLAQEAARPYYAYHPYYTAPEGVVKGNKPSKHPSPLLVQPSDFVLLHFQLRSDGRLSSPQSPDVIEQQYVLDNGGNLLNISKSALLCSEIKECIDYQQLLRDLPTQTLSTIAAGQTVWINNKDLAQVENPQIVKNMSESRQVKQQLAIPQNNAPNAPPDPFSQTPDNQSDQVSSNQPANQRSLLQSGNNFQSRNSAYQKFAQQEVFNQRLNLATAPPIQMVREGVSQPLWIDSRLILARRVETGSETIIQGVWLDWEKIKQTLRSEVADLLLQFDWEPVDENSSINVSRLLATLPVQLVVPELAMNPPNLSPIRISLIIAWICLFIATGAVCILLQGVVTLSERRGAFVSAVTHELRTPLTTFRMYAEMLSEGMVPEAEQRQRYLETLRIEADRLSHLVENVLAYARLERGKPGKKRELVMIDSLLSRLKTRLADRASQDQMELIVQVEDNISSLQVSTDSAAVEQILFNLVDNACKYACTAKDRRIFLQVSKVSAEIHFRVQDKGPGILASEAKRLFRPFSKSAQQAASSAPGVGLGLALCRRLARALGGRLVLESNTGVGASFLLALPQSSGKT